MTDDINDGITEQARSKDFGEEGPEFRSQHQMEALDKCWKAYMRFGALYNICYTKIINLANFKVMFFSAFFGENICNCKKHTAN